MASLEHDCKSEAEAHALAEFPREACGLVVDGKYWPCRNVAADPCADFVLDPRDYLAAALSGTIEAVIHSHPEDTPPSPADLSACQQSKLRWYIYQPGTGQWLTINP